MGSSLLTTPTYDSLKGSPDFPKASIALAAFQKARNVLKIVARVFVDCYSCGEGESCVGGDGRVLLNGLSRHKLNN